MITINSTDLGVSAKETIRLGGALMISDV